MGLKEEGKPSTEDVELMRELQKQLRLNLRLWTAIEHSGDLILSTYSSQSQHLEELLTRTLNLGESNSALVIAARGTGKSALINAVLKKLEISGTLGNGLVVHLSGLLQTNDRHALREITSQLQLEAATANKVFGSFAENLAYLLECLRCGTKESSKPIIFVLDEFDHFCHHRNQTLLYNLFDVAQSAQAPICVVGLTCRLDVIELLEKRVKSRFSHRQIHLFSDDKFDPGYLNIFKTLLQIPTSFPSKTYAKIWNSHVSSLAEDDNVKKILKRQYDTSHDIRSLKSMLLLGISQVSAKKPHLTHHMLSEAQRLINVEAKISILQGLSTLQICLVVAMKHLTTVYEGEPFNFEMIYREYMKFSHKKSSMQSYDRPVIFKAFDQLKSLELVRCVDSTRGIRQEYQLLQLMMTPLQIVEAIPQLPNIPTDIEQWACSSLL
ncbi:origin recognition complex subunit 4 [Halocaridina rubra]|uniref:Origin recognition complex subunit 4 n=1 Tax=Halocaridina rubra TaxID=373956 RepID=A0AAN8XEX1_HALRR